MQSILGVKYNVGAGEETCKGGVNKVDEVGAGEERGKGKVNKLEGWTKTEGAGVAGEILLRASMRSVRIWSSSIAERISSEMFPSLKLRTAIGFGRIVTNVGAGGFLITSV